MELSPLARERLARISALSGEEQQRLARESELNAILSGYFKGELDADVLWKRLKELKDQTGEPVVAEAQGKLLETLRLQMGKEDFELRRDAVLALETLKQSGKYPTLEMGFRSLEGLREQYEAAKNEAYQQVRATVARQLESVAEQVKMQGLSVDTERSVDANVRNSPQWKEFIGRHDRASEQVFARHLSELRAAL